MNFKWNSHQLNTYIYLSASVIDFRKQYDQLLVILGLSRYQTTGRFLAERSSHRFRLPNILQSTSVTYLWNLHSLITVTRSYRNRTCFPFNQPIFNMKNILYFMYCSISRIKTAGTNYLLYETFNILAYPLPIYNNHFSLANHSKYGILIKYLQKTYLETYRSGHNGAHSKCVSPPGHVGSNPTNSVCMFSM